MAKSDPATRDKLIAQWTEELNSLDLSYRFPIGAIFGILLCIALGLGAFYVTPLWLEGMNWLGIVIGCCFLFIGVCIFGSANQGARNTQKSNKNKADRLTRKIQEIS